ncbi:MAG TPA: twin-arginine translocation signal domain-containing protein, partial [Methanocella sp.]
MQGPPLTRRKFLKAAGAASALVLGSAVLGCTTRSTDPLPVPTGSPTPLPGGNPAYTIASEVRAAFADYVPLPVTVTPSLAKYSVRPDLSGVAGLEFADLDAAGKALLA